MHFIGEVWRRCGPIEWVDPTPGHAIKVCVWDNACWGALLHPATVLWHAATVLGSFQEAHLKHPKASH